MSKWRIEQRDNQWQVITPPIPFNTHAEAVTYVNQHTPKPQAEALKAIFKALQVAAERRREQTTEGKHR